MTNIITIIFFAAIIWLFAFVIGNAIATIVIHFDKKIRRFIKRKREAK